VGGLSLGFNVNYLLDALGALQEATVLICVRDASSSVLLREPSHERTRHVVMPLRL
jgi:DNA polymerase-3 subunit beta